MTSKQIGTFFYKTKNETGPSILLIKTTKGNLFGAFQPVPWEQSSKYYGSGETFVFTFVPKFAYYSWSKKNKFFVRSVESSITIGGSASDGKAALYIDGELQHGSTYKCDTFMSEPLNAIMKTTVNADYELTNDFDIFAIECWAFEEMHKSEQIAEEKQSKKKKMVFGMYLDDYRQEDEEEDENDD